ncbi:alcohol dehydrogenase, partial [Streptococcus suis]|uniref:alcohol dehydrogenase catalytic domain-containing protein n=1 Tax=Streptococcus suis TaxID=1307 RepID=UPI001174F8D6
MKAIVLRELGGPDKLQYEETEKPQAGPRDVVVRLKTAALNRRDVFITYGQYPNVKLPAIPGSDGAGVVAEVGPDVDADWDGREVIVNPGLYWGNNPRVNARTFSILGVPKNGT